MDKYISLITFILVLTFWYFIPVGYKISRSNKYVVGITLGLSIIIPSFWTIGILSHLIGSVGGIILGWSFIISSRKKRRKSLNNVVSLLIQIIWLIFFFATITYLFLMARFNIITEMYQNYKYNLNSIFEISMLIISYAAFFWGTLSWITLKNVRNGNHK